MRQTIAKILLSLLEAYTPPLFVRLELQILLDTTARAFAVPSRRIWQLSAQNALRAYAAFTTECMQNASIRPGRLYRTAFALGHRLRRLTGFTDDAELSRLVVLLYRGIGITIDGHLPGEIAVPSCFFSRYYTPKQCALMSCVDAGVIAGLYGGGRLVFTERITEGCQQCLAEFTKEQGLQ
ncbi:MAG: hypothetical protein IJ682_00385 [Lachnospiraceae bacterium]|nr:hypothetical protein [Lachnospiraceae bacterium]